MGGKGNDQITGGNGSDLFVFNSGTGDDTVTGFTGGTDMIEIRSGAQSFAGLTITDQGGDALVAFDDASVLLQGVAIADLTEDDFLF